jgi:hypothetical protein
MVILYIYSVYWCIKSVFYDHADRRYSTTLQCTAMLLTARGHGGQRLRPNRTGLC